MAGDSRFRKIPLPDLVQQDGIPERILLVSFRSIRNPCSPQIGGTAPGYASGNFHLNGANIITEIDAYRYWTLVG
jgi:hypothetical protein